MNFKKILASIVAGTSLLMMVGSAFALSSDINIYGASAQFNFWKAQADTYLDAQGCTAQGYAKTTDGKNFIGKGTCGGTTRYFRVSSKASYDGPLAIQGNTTNPNRTTACADPKQRKMMDETLVTSWGATAATATTMADTAASKCVTVTGGASDVQVTSFQQESHGALKGPAGGVWTDRNFKGTGAITANGLSANCRTLVVPFGFFVNKGVTSGGTTITDITTADARLIFSGQVYDWSELGYDAKPIRTCYRHAGSGTAAALDFDVMRPASLYTLESAGDGFYFNDGAADEMACINGNTGGVGYADADQALSSYPNVAAVTYNGVAPTKANIKAGQYDFYTTQNLYMATPTPADMTTLCSFMKNPANNTNAWYANVCEMNYIRSDDGAYNTYNPDLGLCN